MDQTTTETDESWSQQAKLVAEDGDERDGFGWSVAVSDDGTTALVGAKYDEDPNGRAAGSAYVFEEDGASWSQRAKLVADDGEERDYFGESVALSGDGTTSVIGAGFEDPPYGDESAAAYVFENSGGSWRQQAKLDADDGEGGDFFGTAVGVTADGTAALVGAKRPDADAPGSAYVFQRSEGSWRQRAELAADDGEERGTFGESVAVSNDGTTAHVTAADSAYIYDGTGESWSQQAKLDAGSESGDQFGESVAVSSEGTTALVSAHGDPDPNGKEAGSAYVFDL